MYVYNNIKILINVLGWKLKAHIFTIRIKWLTILNIYSFAYMYVNPKGICSFQKKPQVNLYIEFICNPFSRGNEMCISRERIVSIERTNCNQIERINNPWERILNPRERIVQFNITINLCYFFENLHVRSGLSYIWLSSLDFVCLFPSPGDSVVLFVYNNRYIKIV